MSQRDTDDDHYCHPCPVCGEVVPVGPTLDAGRCPACGATADDLREASDS